MRRGRLRDVVRGQRDVHQRAAAPRRRRRRPPDLLLAETDAPFLTPVPNRGRPNAPAQVAYTLRCLAEVQGLDLADLCDTVTATAERTFGPW